MKAADAIRYAMIMDGVTQQALAESAGYKGQSAIANAISRKHGMRIDVFVRLARGLDYEIVMRRGNEEFKITE